MSLINDALKKAQKQRTGQAPDLNKLPSIGGEAPARIAKRDQPPAFNSLVLWVSVGATAVLILSVGGFFLIRWMMRSPGAQPAVAATPAKEIVVAQITPAAKVVPAPTSVQTAVPVIAAPTPAVITVKPAIPEVAVETKPVEVAPLVPAPTPVAEAKPVTAAAAPKMGPKAVAFIDALRIAGVRASSTDSKVLMNDRVYRVGDIVEHVLGLKITGINADSLTFEDESGASYTRKL
ncbi:MAG TPA: hypothetical protein VGM64_12040 [Lacunisphaera sp.]|jgi:hypothetical protein